MVSPTCVQTEAARGLRIADSMKSHLLYVLGTASAFAIACGSSGGGGSSSGTTFTPHFPKFHRETAVACGVAAPGNADPKYIPDAGGDAAVSTRPNLQCLQDADCTKGKDGRCVQTNGGFAGPGQACVYTACTSDSECATGSVCQCSTNGSSCVPSGCHTDSECTDKLGCSPSRQGYRCHTRTDECVDDSDCIDPSSRGPAKYCDFNAQKGHWSCVQPGYDE